MQQQALPLGRRAALALGAAVLPRPAVAQPAAATRMLRFVPHANLANLDPIWSTQLISRIHGFMVYDTLYGTDADLRVHPQMAAGHALEEGGTVCTVTLREGLRFHDGEPVLARDCTASLQRWMRRSPVGQTLAERLDALEAPDDRSLVFRLKRPFPHLLAALGSVASPVPFVMPERHARTDPFRQVTEVVGSRSTPPPWHSDAVGGRPPHHGRSRRQRSATCSAPLPGHDTYCEGTRMSI